jgi:hypothetical protein
MKTNQEAGKRNVTQKLASVCLAQCQKLAAQIAQAKNNLVAEFKETFGGQERLIQLAVNEAEALAWETEYPHLVFPSLALEKVKVAANWQQRQQLVRRTNPIFAFAA